MKRVIGLTALALLAATVALAGPGDPFGGDDTGCVPDTADHLKCELLVARGLAKIVKGAIACHMKQASAGFAGAGFGEGGCEQSVEAKFDKLVNKLTVKGLCPQAVLDNAAAAENVLLGGPTQTSPPSMDAFNASIFCDSTSGALLANVNGDNDDDDTGWVPADSNNLRCALGVAKNVIKLWTGLVAKCHVRAAKFDFIGFPFDEEACEEDSLKGVRAKYDAAAAKLVGLNACPPCLGGAAQAALADQVSARVESENGDTFVCP